MAKNQSTFSDDSTTSPELPPRLSVLVIDPDHAFADSLIVQLRRLEPLALFDRTPGDKAEHLRHVYDACLVDTGPGQRRLSHTLSRYASGVSASAIIAMSRDDSPDVRMEALMSGAHDFVSKAYLHPTDLILRIKAHSALRVRSGPLRHSRRVPFGRLVVDVDLELITIDGAPVPLSRQHRRLLTRLAQAPGHVVPHRELCEFAGIQLSRHQINLHNQVSRLRKRLGPLARQLTSVPGAGLRLEQPHG